MGCHGALNGLRVARAYADADRNARVLVCAVELCSLHYHYGWNPKRMVANALFADGAAAVVGRKTDEGDESWSVAATGSCLFPDSEYAMTWHVGDHGFDMTLSTRVPNLIAANLPPVDRKLAARKPADPGRHRLLGRASRRPAHLDRCGACFGPGAGNDGRIARGVGRMRQHVVADDFVSFGALTSPRGATAVRRLGIRSRAGGRGRADSMTRAESRAIEKNARSDRETSSIFQGIFIQRNAHRRNGLQPPPAASDAAFFLGDEFRVKEPLIERAIANQRLEIRVNDILRQGRVAANMAFGDLMERKDGNFTQDVTKVEVRFGDRLDILAAHFAQIPLIAPGHDASRPKIGIGGSFVVILWIGAGIE